MPRVRTFLFFVSMAFALSFLAGCRDNAKELESRILKDDPGFQDVLENRNDLREQIALQKAGYDKKVASYDSRIAALREQKALARSEYEASLDKVERQLEPVVRQLKAELVDMRRRLEMKSIQMRNIERDTKEIEALIDKKDTLAFTQEEIKTWNDRLAALVESKAEVSADEQKLKDDIKTTKLKIKVMQL